MKYFALLLLSLGLLASCSSPATQPSYEENKKMFIDALQTEDGKKAIRTLLSDPQFKELLVLDSEQVKTSVEQTMLSKEAEDFWKEVYSDPKFSETMAKSMVKQQEELMKALMKDPNYLKDLETFFSSAEMKKELAKVLESSDMRKEMQKVVEETIKSPVLQAKWQKLVEEAGGKTEKAGGGSEGGGEEGGAAGSSEEDKKKEEEEK
ncbi:spore germination protein D [Paenisporosarcina quisquiliarum]|uniref:spore germination lipoprotein GerD n=1 Tax=Psychrobacillus psychrodurans TaxID=126157 RepID=UPI0008B13561|nr:spore germination lipoprotein GerD [Psychrobacillus psychrodurans]MCK1997697.1 spore germination lipoprotein GerD [Psychrobacillus psychrodurans]SEN36817.1 spore germination protein D [Paenisporosarcina quisquiliarum]